MKRKFIFLLALCLLLAVPVLAQVSASFDLSWHVIAGGGGSSSGAGHTLTGSVGQPWAGSMVGGGQRLCSGFWCGGAAAQSYRVYLPLALRNH